MTPLIASYLESYADVRAKQAYLHFSGDSFHQAVVIPVLNESALIEGAIESLIRSSQEQRTTTLLIIVVNHSESHPEAWKKDNLELLEKLKKAKDHLPIFILDCASPGNELPPKSGVGLARKVGADFALTLYHHRHLASPWIRTTDADGRFERDYLAPLDSYSGAGLIYPFVHLNPFQEIAIDLYDRYLRYYENGLRYAKSPYAFPTIGSLIAFHAEHYAAVRGFPVREAGEDFYFLNKLRKTGSIGLLNRSPVQLIPRKEVRVPFGTTKSQLTIGDSLRQGVPYTVYHPEVFFHLKELLEHFNDWSKETEGAVSLPLSAITLKAWVSMDGPLQIEIAKRTRRVAKSRLKHFHDWFDAFKTLKWTHYLTEHNFNKLPLSTAEDLLAAKTQR